MLLQLACMFLSTFQLVLHQSKLAAALRVQWASVPKRSAPAGCKHTSCAAGLWSFWLKWVVTCFSQCVWLMRKSQFHPQQRCDVQVLFTFYANLCMYTCVQCIFGPKVFCMCAFSGGNQVLCLQIHDTYTLLLNFHFMQLYTYNFKLCYISEENILLFSFNCLAHFSSPSCSAKTMYLQVWRVWALMFLIYRRINCSFWDWEHS